MVDLVEIGKRIQGRRKQMGLTQEQLADKMDVSIQMVSNLERGNKSVRIENLIKLSEILNISTDYILTGKETAEDMQVLIEQMTSLSQKERKMMKLLMDFCLSENDE